MSIIEKKIANKLGGNTNELKQEHWIFLLALIDQSAFQGTQIEIAFEIKQIIQSKIQGK